MHVIKRIFHLSCLTSLQSLNMIVETYAWFSLHKVLITRQFRFNAKCLGCCRYIINVCEVKTVIIERFRVRVIIVLNKKWVLSGPTPFNVVWVLAYKLSRPFKPYTCSQENTPHNILQKRSMCVGRTTKTFRSLSMKDSFLFFFSTVVAQGHLRRRCHLTLHNGYLGNGV